MSRTCLWSNETVSLRAHKIYCLILIHNKDIKSNITVFEQDAGEEEEEGGKLNWFNEKKKFPLLVLSTTSTLMVFTPLNVSIETHFYAH